MIMKNLNRLILVSGLIAGSMTVMATPFDGSNPLVCAIQQVSQCDAGTDCIRVSPESVSLPDLFIVDAGNQAIMATPESGSDRKTAIERSEILDGKLVLQGADEGIEDVRDGLGWTMAIDAETGKLVLSASGDGFAMVVFGACAVR
jgi:hypothetical protein